MLNTCGIPDDQISWNNGRITVQVGDDIFSTDIGSMQFNANGNVDTAKEGRARLVRDSTYVSWDMLNAWKHYSSTNSPLQFLEVGIGISTRPNGPAVIVY